MKVPICWLKDYVDYEDSVEGLADKLTFSGIEVEAIDTIGSDYVGVVVGEVKEVSPHPNADKLTLCTVFDGEKDYQVVCGAPNVETGGKYPFATIGVTLPVGMKLKKAKIRGIESQGMLCAEDELGLSDDHEGLMVLDADATAGTPLSEILGPPEIVLDLEITPNRPDCLSMIGIAREVAALYGSTLKRPEINLPETAESAETLTTLTIEDEERCPRYTARILKNIKLAESPDWMKKRLQLSGVRPINNVVDITNFVMLECGHPMHAFDQDWLKEGRIVVRRAHEGEKMTTLDEVERTLSADMLVIADAERAVAMAGVMGGANSDIKDTTKTVLLESAYFSPDPIRQTSRQLGLSSESSYRFERGTDINNTEWASRRGAMLMVELADAQCAAGVVDAYPTPKSSWQVSCRRDRLETLLGLETSIEEMARIFEELELHVLSTDNDTCVVEVPTFRGDLEREVDLIEEFSRIYGLDKIPAPAPQTKIIPDADDREVKAASALRNTLVGLGLREIMNYSLLSERMLDLFNADNQNERIVLPHPISMDQSVLRTSLIPQMMESLGHNRARQIREACFFEMGRVFFKNEDGSTREQENVSFGIMGPVGRDAMKKRQASSPDETFLWIKGLIGVLLKEQHLNGATFRAATSPHLMDGYTVEIHLGDTVIGLLGIVKKEIAKEWRFHDPVAVAELNMAPLLAHTFDIPVIRDVPAYPPIERDMALIVDKNLPHEDILKVIRTNAPKELENIQLFDIFENDAIGKGKKSMAYEISYRSANRTLTDEDANRYHNKVKRALQKALDLEIREG